MKILYIDPTRLFWVNTIILISNIGNLHVYLERTVIRNTRVRRYTYVYTVKLIYSLPFVFTALKWSQET